MTWKLRADESTFRLWRKVIVKPENIDVPLDLPQIPADTVHHFLGEFADEFRILDAKHHSLVPGDTLPLAQ
jgi:hypothetical protein